MRRLKFATEIGTGTDWNRSSEFQLWLVLLADQDNLSAEL
jgi:hypothetical protein